ncbi:MAG: FtsW/RodA/SpoVE family cell cycle protein [Cellulosilyticaceae bacterium]
MAYLNLMILMSRYVFIGFSLVFIVVAFSFMRPFISYNLGSSKHKNTLLYLCICFFHIGATAILIGTALDETISNAIFVNSVTVLLTITIARWVLKLTKKEDQLVMWHLIFFLTDIGYIMIERLEHNVATKQVGWIVVGTICALTMPYVFKKLINPKYKILYMLVMLTLNLLPFVFGERVYGAINWVQIGGIGFQPSEFAKIAFLMYLASVFHDFEKSKYKLRTIVEVCGISALCILILVLQKDLGGAMLYFLTFLILLYVGTKKILLPLTGLAAGCGASVIAYFLFSHVRVRVEAWKNPWIDIENSGYQIAQGLFAMGTWGFAGSGLTRGIPEQIPFVTTDYIFPAISEEFGNIVAIVVLLCFLGIVLQGLKVALIQTDNFTKLLTVGIVTLFALQALIILCGVLKIIPLTGVTLPFVSYGGSSMLTCFIMTGLLGYLLSTSRKTLGKENGDEK